jgi:hypothetical protein
MTVLLSSNFKISVMVLDDCSNPEDDVVTPATITVA